MVQQLNAPLQQSGAVAATGMPNMQPLSVTGSKFQYVRLVAAPASQQGQAATTGTGMSLVLDCWPMAT